MKTKHLLPPAAAAVTAAALLAAPAPARTGGPAVIPLPSGYQPEGIASGTGNRLYVGSIPTGRVTLVDARTGAIDEIVPQRPGRSAIGLKVDRGRIFVAGGMTGRAFVYDARTGEDVANVLLTEGTTFVNDVVVTKAAAYFTDSRRQQLYRLPLGPGGAPAAAAQTVPITGAFQIDADDRTLEANGIAATPDGKTLFVVQTRTGKLFRVDPRTGVSTEVPITGTKDNEGLVNGDGLLLQGRTLYVVQNRSNQILQIRLDAKRTSGRVTATITNEAFAVPTTIARTAGDLFTVNARFGTPPDQAKYEVVRVDEPKKRAKTKKRN